MDPPPLEFPCDYPLKVMGRRTAEFRAAVCAVLVPEPTAGAPLHIEERSSRDGNFVSLTCTVHVDSRAALDLLYRRLHATGLVLYAL